jgi:arsenate reductase
MAAPDRYGVLFLCTGNSARSIIAESLLRHWGHDRFDARSAGSEPAGFVREPALRLLADAGLPTDGLRSKSWEAFTAADGPRIDFVITVCDDAAERCPVFPGRPIVAHWGTPDPAAIEGDPETVRAAYRRAYTDIERRIKLLVNLPLASLDRMARKQELDAIGRDAADTPA